MRYLFCVTPMDGNTDTVYLMLCIALQHLYNFTIPPTLSVRKPNLLPFTKLQITVAILECTEGCIKPLSNMDPKPGKEKRLSVRRLGELLSSHIYTELDLSQRKET